MRKSLMLVFALLVAFSIMAPAFTVAGTGDDATRTVETKKKGGDDKGKGKGKGKGKTSDNTGGKKREAPRKD